MARFSPHFPLSNGVPRVDTKSNSTGQSNCVPVRMPQVDNDTTMTPAKAAKLTFPQLEPKCFLNGRELVVM